MCLNCQYDEECCALLLHVNLLGTLFLAMCFTEFLFFQQENAILTMELRNYFSLYCLHQETQLIHIYLPLTSHILGAFVNSQIQGHKEVSSSGLCFPKRWMRIWMYLFSAVGLPPLIICPAGLFHNFLRSHLRSFQFGVRVQAGPLKIPLLAASCCGFLSFFSHLHIALPYR